MRGANFGSPFLVQSSERLTHFKVEEKEMTSSIFGGHGIHLVVGKVGSFHLIACFPNESVLKGGMEGRGGVLRKRYKAATTGSF